MIIKSLAVSVIILTASSYLSWETVNQSVYAAPAELSACQPEGTKVCGDEFINIGTPRHGGSSATCKPGFSFSTPRVCFTPRQTTKQTYSNAEVLCRGLGGRVADYVDWRYRKLLGSTPLPIGLWIGPITADNRALFINSTDVANFEAETSRFEFREYSCAHDRS